MVSPNWPLDYPNVADCRWHIALSDPVGVRAIRLRVNFFDTELAVDVVSVLNGGVSPEIM